MDASALRWVLAIIGVVVIAGIYLYSLYQEKLQRRAAIKTFTQDELEAGLIEDENLTKELSNINTMLDDDIDKHELNGIKINPGLEDDAKKQESKESGSRKLESKKTPPLLPELLTEIHPDNLVVHILKRADDQLLTAEELTDAFAHTGFTLDSNFYFRLNDNTGIKLELVNMTASGSFNKINDPGFCSAGLVCYFDKKQCKQPVRSYDLMLKTIDELVKVLDLKVYNQDFQLLTLQHVTEIRTRIKGDG